jgi:hypothetical protein
MRKFGRQQDRASYDSIVVANIEAVESVVDIFEQARQ